MKTSVWFEASMLALILLASLVSGATQQPQRGSAALASASAEGR